MLHSCGHVRTRELHYTIFVGFLARFAMSCWSGYWGPSFGGEQDALGFHVEAVAYSRDAVFDEFTIGHIYAYALGVVYWLTTDSIFIGCLLSTFTWLASAYVLLESMRLLETNEDGLIAATRIYALLPSSIALTSVTLREAYETFFVTVAMHGALHVYVRGTAGHWFTIVLGVVGMSVLHGGLFAFGIYFLIGTVLLASMRGQRIFSIVRVFVASPFIVWIAVTGISLFGAVSYQMDDGLDAAVQTYQQGTLHQEARATYKDFSDIESPLGLAVYGPIGFLQYLFEPMPWRSLRVVDVDAIGENLLRAWLILRAWAGIRAGFGERRRLVTFIFLSYIVVEVIWSLGTVNWGTALRHHLPSTGLLLVSAFTFAQATRTPVSESSAPLLRPNPWHRQPKWTDEQSGS